MSNLDQVNLVQVEEEEDNEDGRVSRRIVRRRESDTDLRRRITNWAWALAKEEESTIPLKPISPTEKERDAMDKARRGNRGKSSFKTVAPGGGKSGVSGSSGYGKQPLLKRTESNASIGSNASVKSSASRGSNGSGASVATLGSGALRDGSVAGEFLVVNMEAETVDDDERVDDTTNRASEAETAKASEQEQPLSRENKRKAEGSPEFPAIGARGKGAVLGADQIDEYIKMVLNAATTISDSTTRMSDLKRAETINAVNDIQKAFTKVSNAYLQLLREQSVVANLSMQWRQDLSRNLGRRIEENKDSVTEAIHYNMGQYFTTRKDERQGETKALLSTIKDMIKADRQVGDANLLDRMKEVIKVEVDKAVKDAPWDAGDAAMGDALAASVEEVSSRVVREVRDAVQTGNIGQSVRSAMTEMLNSGSDGSGRNTYASMASDWQDVVGRRAKLRTVKVPQGPEVTVKGGKTFVIMPKEEAKGRYTSSEITKKEAIRLIDPAAFNLRVDNVTRVPGNGIKVTASTVDLAKLKASTVLTEVGLVVCDNVKLNPRVAIHGVPVEMNRETMVASLIKDNKLTAVECVKPIFQYNPANKRATTWIVELAPEDRTKLQEQERVYLGWVSCRFNDHVRILQCFRCLGFGHMSTQCRFASEICDHCGGGHERNKCDKVREEPCCYNCKSAGLANTKHSARDGEKCPILGKRLDERVQSINYG